MSTGMKRFYKNVEFEVVGSGYRILLDGKPVPTTGRRDLLCPSLNVAEIVTKEWAAQVDIIKPETMPITQFLMTAIDHIEHQRNRYQDEILRYIDTDLICYPSQDDPEIMKRETEIWDPLLDQIEALIGQRPQKTFHLQMLKQDQVFHDFFSDFLSQLSLLNFTIFYILVGESNSVFLTYLFFKGCITPDNFTQAMFLYEDHKAKIYEAEKYGEAPDLMKKRISIEQSLKSAQSILFS
jgi:chaperone required for assembly of F1-ATPase